MPPPVVPGEALIHGGTAIIFFYLSNEGVSLVENAAHLSLPVPEKLKAVVYNKRPSAKRRTALHPLFGCLGLDVGRDAVFDQHSFYLSNEGVSLLENAAHLGLPVPQKLKDVLEHQGRHWYTVPSLPSMKAWTQALS